MNNTSEVFVAVKGFEDYKIGNHGTVLSKSGKPMSPSLCKDNYRQVNFLVDGKTKSRLVHKLVAEHFIPKPEGNYDVDHIDHDRENNRADNLQWLAHKENIKKSALAGRRRTTLTWADIPVIKEKYAAGATSKMLAEEYKVSWGTINNVVKGITWTQQEI